MTATAQAIIEEIRVAFRGVPREKITLHEAEELDNYAGEETCAAARLLDPENNWEDVPDASIEECIWALPHLDSEGWRFYIPARMIWSLHNFRTSDSIISDFTIYTFDSSSGDSGLKEYHLERFRLLNDKQSKVVCRFLRHMIDNEDRADGDVARRALESYWGQFCDQNT